MTSIAPVTDMVSIETNDTFDHDSYVTQLTEEQIRIFIPTLVYVAILIVTGILGNSLVLYVYMRNWTASTARVFILCLAFIDMVNCLVTLPMEIVTMFYPLMFDFPVLCKGFRSITMTINATSACVLVSIGADILHRINVPFAKHLTSRKAKIACFVCMLVAMIFMWPSWLIFGVDRNKILSTPHGNITISPCLMDSRYKPYQRIFFTYLSSTTILCLVILSILYGTVGCKLYKDSKNWTRSGSSHSWTSGRLDCEKNNNEDNDKNSQNKKRTESSNEGKRKLSKSRSNSITSVMSSMINRTLSRKSSILPKLSLGKRTTIMLFVVTVIYTVSFIPYMVLATVRALNPDFVRSMSTPSQMVYHLVKRSYLINSAINPIVYSLCNGRFRSKCKMVLLSLLRRKH